MPKKKITRTRQYLRGSEICIPPRSCRDFTIIREKEIQGAAIVFLLTLKTRPHQRNTSAPAWAYRPKSPLHGLSLSKSPIKNHSTLFESDRVIKLD